LDPEGDYGLNLQFADTTIHNSFTHSINIYSPKLTTTIKACTIAMPFLLEYK